MGNKLEIQKGQNVQGLREIPLNYFRGIIMNACTFIGHQDCDRSIVPTLYAEIEKLILCENVSTFYVGNNGRFDFYVYQALCELEKSYDI